MFGIDITSWLVLLVQGLSIIIGFILGAVLTLILQRRQWDKEQAEKDMVEIYRPLLWEINKLLENEKVWRRSPTSPYSTYIATYEKQKLSGRINLKIHDELRGDMDDLIDRINDENNAFNILLNKLKSLCKEILESISVIMRKGEPKIKSFDYYHTIDVYEIIYGNREEWGANFDNTIKRIEEMREVDKVDQKITGNKLFDQLFSQIRNQREDSFSKRDEIFAKAKEIKEKLYYKTRYPKKRHGDQ